MTQDPGAVEPSVPAGQGTEEAIVGDAIEWTRRRWQEEGAPKPSHFAAMTAILRTSVVVTTEVEAVLKGCDMTLRAYLLLVTLQMAPDRTKPLGQLSKALLVHPTTVTMAVDQLEATGLVSRVRHPSDRRTILATLTDDGERAVSDASRALAEIDFGLNGTTATLADRLSADLRDVRVALGDRG